MASTLKQACTFQLCLFIFMPRRNLLKYFSDEPPRINPPLGQEFSHKMTKQFLDWNGRDSHSASARQENTAASLFKSSTTFEIQNRYSIVFSSKFVLMYIWGRFTEQMKYWIKSLPSLSNICPWPRRVYQFNTCNNPAKIYRTEKQSILAGCFVPLHVP